MKKMISLVLSILLISLQSFVAIAAEDANEEINVSAKSAILMDAKTGKILYEKDSHEKLPPASVTKVMTLLLIMEAIDSNRLKLDDKVTISERAASMGGSQLFLEPGEAKKAEDLIKGIAVASANDGCLAMAEHIYGSEEAFVKKMNQRAKELGMKDTHFVNTNGLPVDKHYTSSHDIAVMSRELIKHDRVFKYLTIWMDEISVGKQNKKIGLVNTNKLIRFYKGANGIKTGFTNEAKFCLSASASRDNLNLIAVVLGSPSSKDRFNDASSLLNYGFANYETVKIYNKGDIVKKITLDKSNPESIGLVCKEPLCILVKKGQNKDFKKDIKISKKIKFPIAANQKLGEIEIYQGNKLILKSDLISPKEIKKAGYGRMFKKVIDNML